MSTYTIRPANPAPIAVTRRGRPVIGEGIRQIQLHSTRGNAPMDRQVQATENWFGSPANDRGGWGGSADFLVGPDHRIGGNIAIVQFGDWLTTYSSWSAGFGSDWRKQYGAATVGVAIEIAQPAIYDPFTPETVKAVAWLVRHINQELRDAGREPIPIQRIPEWDQWRADPVPWGIVGHEDLANGKKLGKTDPGPEWPWESFLALTIASEWSRAAMQERVATAEAEAVRLRAAAVDVDALRVLLGETRLDASRAGRAAFAAKEKAREAQTATEGVSVRLEAMERMLGS